VSGARVGVDVGGTFTDLVALAGGRIVTAKVPSTPHDQSEGVLRSIEASGVPAAEVDALAHGMTVATNALLERRGARTALVTTAGFRDVIEIGRQARPSLYDLTEDRPPALVPRELRFTVRERMGPDGELEPLDRGSLDEAIDALHDADVEAVAVCLVFAFAHPEHERAVAEAVREALPGVHVSLSSDVLPEFREYERFSTTVADAYLAPALGSYLSRLRERTTEAGLPDPLVMQSSGGVIGIEDAGRGAAAFALSGPAGGVVGAAHAAAASGYRDLLTFDMGGTSTDVGAVIDGRVTTTTESTIGGVPLKLPAVDVHTVSAGGGSIAWADPGGALRVGPRSAGADPGPAAYGRGGEMPTVTDANVFLGYIADGATLGGELVLERERAETALATLGERLGLDALNTALGTVSVAEAEMVRALRVVSVERGIDPRELVLVAFGGAGPLHACALAEELGTRTVLVPRASGVLSALGLALSDLRRDYVKPLLGSGAGAGAAFEQMERRAREELGDPVLERASDMRYRGQSFELTVSDGQSFHDAHERRYGYRLDDEEVELVNARVTATVERERPPLRDEPGEGDAQAGSRRASVDGGWVDLAVYDRDRMGAGSRVEGPAIVELRESTCLVRAGWAGAVDEAGTLVLERS
jgi:N-methylhydantoinase A